MSWDPLRDLRVWHERLERLTDHRPDSWTPPIDVYETPDRYVVAAEVPGLAREHIDLALEDSRLTIRGQRIERGTTAADILQFHQVERGHGSFARTFEFGSNIDIEAVSADLTNGVLTITLPKATRPPARKIEVR
jgi:HSP20 family protein